VADASPGLPEIWRTVERLERRLDEHEGRFVRLDVYRAERDADRARIKRIEDEDTSKTSGTRTWLYGVATAAVGALFGGIAQVLMAKGR
jgi:hypothetical protein